MKSPMLLRLWQKVAEESATICCTSAMMDIKTVHHRVDSEGISFLTITLPSFGKDFEESLDLKRVDRHLFQGFSWKAGLPRFLGGFLGRVFDSDGVLLDEPDVDSIRAIRQLTLMFSKIELPCSPERERKAFRQYIECEEDVREIKSSVPSTSVDEFRMVRSLVFDRAFAAMARECHHTNLVPKHGPGATADKLRGNSKFRQSTWPRRLDKVLPFDSFLVASPNFEEDLADVDILDPEHEIPVKVISVPKTLKTPRIIGVEPTAMQYAQQSVLPVVLDALSRDKFLSKALGFVDQSPNQEMARKGSEDGTLATLDLSEASDRVSNWLVRIMLEEHPQLSEVVQATRSRKANVPGYGVIEPLAKFASMGSALCFPIEAMIFLIVVLVGIQRSRKTPFRTRREVMNLLSGRVRIYGDDIIIPVEHVQAVVDALHEFGFVVNTHKSFWNGQFRESCGKEYFAGQDVSIVKVRQVWPSQRRRATEVISAVSLRNQLYFAGYWQTVRWLDEQLEKLLKHFPTVLPTSPVLGRHSFLGFHAKKLDEATHAPVVRGYVVPVTPPSDPLEEGGALLKCFLKASHEADPKGPPLPVASENHLERAGRPKSVQLRLRWASAV